MDNKKEVTRMERGNVYWVRDTSNVSNKVIGHSSRPMVLISAPAFFAGETSVHMVPCTSNQYVPGVPVCLDHPSTLKVTAICQVPIGDIGRLIGHLTDTKMAELDTVVSVYLGLTEDKDIWNRYIGIHTGMTRLESVYGGFISEDYQCGLDQKSVADKPKCCEHVGHTEKSDKPKLKRPRKCGPKPNLALYSEKPKPVIVPIGKTVDRQYSSSPFTAGELTIDDILTVIMDPRGFTKKFSCSLSTAYTRRQALEYEYHINADATRALKGLKFLSTYRMLNEEVIEELSLNIEFGDVLEIHPKLLIALLGVSGYDTLLSCAKKAFGIVMPKASDFK